MTPHSSRFDVRSSMLDVRCFSFVLVLLLVLDLRAQDQVSLLTLFQAHEIALKNPPRISGADLRALAAREVTREARSAFFPNVYGSVVAVGTAHDNTRLAAIGGL